MFEVFDAVFMEVMEMLGIQAWYELYDSEEFSVVEEMLVEQFGQSVLQSEEYQAWLDEMYGDL